MGHRDLWVLKGQIDNKSPKNRVDSKEEAA